MIHLLYEEEKEVGGVIVKLSGLSWSDLNLKVFCVAQLNRSQEGTEQKCRFTQKASGSG